MHTKSSKPITITRSALNNFILHILDSTFATSTGVIISYSQCNNVNLTGGKEGRRPELTSPQTFSYERHFGTVGLGQVNISGLYCTMTMTKYAEQ